MAVNINREQCVKCAGCVGVCPFAALDYIGDEICIDAKLCTECGTCVKFCPVGALSLQNKNK